MTSGWTEPRRSPLIRLEGRQSWLLALTVGTALLLGGGTAAGLGSDAVVQLISLALLLSVGITGLKIGGPRRSAPFVIAAAILALPLLQLIPVPPQLWETFPGRGEMVTIYTAIGLGLPWLPASLDPHATLGAALSLLPGIAVFAATTQLQWQGRRTISLIILAIGMVSVFLGLVQLMEGPSSPLRFFPITNPGDSVGFFANRNHYAALLYCSIAMAIAWLVGLMVDRRLDQPLAIATLGFVCLLLVVGLAMARSRAGVFLVALVVTGGILMANRIGARAGRRIAIVVGAVLGVAGVVAGTYGLPGLLGRFDDGIVDRFRLLISATTARAAEAFLPIGSGFGTFVPIYQRFQTPISLSTSYINHAHNDWLESWLEGGWPAAAIAGAFLVWFLVVAIKVWRSTDLSPIDQALARAATLAIGALLIHSGVDYPLRTTAMMILFSFCCGLLISPPERQALVSRSGRSVGRSGWLANRLGALGRRPQSSWTSDRFG